MELKLGSSVEWRIPAGIPFCPQATGCHPSVCLSVQDGHLAPVTVSVLSTLASASQGKLVPPLGCSHHSTSPPHLHLPLPQLSLLPHLCTAVEKSKDMAISVKLRCTLE